MTEAEFYLVIGVPTITVIVGMTFNVLLFNSLCARMASLEARMLALGTRFNRRTDII